MRLLASRTTSQIRADHVLVRRRIDYLGEVSLAANLGAGGCLVLLVACHRIGLLTVNWQSIQTVTGSWVERGLVRPLVVGQCRLHLPRSIVAHLRVGLGLSVQSIDRVLS